MIELTSGDVKLRPLDFNDAQTLSSLINNKKIWDNLRDALPFPYTLQDAYDFISNSDQEEPILTFAIEFKGEFAGVIGLVKQFDVYRFSAELGFWLGESFWNNGIATKAVQLIINYAFRKMDLIRVYSCVFEYNKSSQRVLEKAGFKLEAIFANAVVKNDIVYNECRYCILK